MAKRGYNLDQRKLLGRRIRQWRQKKGFTQEQLAFAADMDRAYIGELERGKKSIRLDNFLAIAQALGVHPALFFMTAAEAEKAQKILYPELLHDP